MISVNATLNPQSKARRRYAGARPWAFDKEMFHKVTFPPDSEAARQEMKYDCEQRMKNATNTMIVLGCILLAAVMIRLIDPTPIGSFGAKILGVIFAVMIGQGLNWFYERQQLKKLEKSAQ